MRGWMVESRVVRDEFEFLFYLFPELKEPLTRSLVRIMLKEEFSNVPLEGSIEERSDILRRRIDDVVPYVGGSSFNLLP